MQNFPDTSIGRGGSVLSGLLATSNTSGSSSGRDAFGFAKVFADAYENTPAEVTPALGTDPFETSASEQTDDSFLAVDDPYTNTETTAPSTLDSAAQVPTAEIPLTDAELNKVVENLRKDGADEATIKRVKDLAGKPGGVTVADVVKAVANEEPAKLTEGDLEHIKSLLDKLDTTGALSESVLEDLRNGNVTQAWASIMQVLKTAEPNALMDIDRKDVLSLGKAMRLDAETLSLLSKSFGGRDTLQLNADGFKALMGPAQQKLLETETAQHKLALSLETALKPVVKEARERLEAEAIAGGRTSRRTQQSAILIQDTVTRNGFIREGDTTAQQKAAEKSTSGKVEASTEARQKASESQSAAGTVDATQQVAEQQVAGQNAAGEKLSGQTGQNGQAQNGQVQNGQNGTVAGRVENQLFGQNGQNGQNGQSGDQPADSRQDGKGRNETFTGTNGVAGAKTETSASPWDALLQRLDVLPAAVAVNGVTPGRFIPVQAPSPLSGQVLSQVEQGMLSAMRDGTKRLELQLNPLDLGVVNVLLTTRNGEVSAHLRPERPETASLLVQQMEQLRLNLEQQGLKVDKVDVQTQLKDDNGTSWQGMNEHNSAQEQQSRNLDLERMRRLGRGRSTGISGAPRPELAGMARNVSGSESLHIVA